MPQVTAADETAPEILAVIPCLNEEDHLERLVQNLVRANRDLRLRVVIADGGSTDRSLDVAKTLARANDNVVVLHNPGRVQAAAINRAVAVYGAAARYLIRLDAHADYPPDYCRTLLAEAEATRAASVVVGMDTVGLHPMQQLIAATQNSKLGNGGSAHRTAGVAGAWVEHGHHALMRLEAFMAVGGYDENFVCNEDAELDVRLRRAGYPIWLTRKTVQIYYPRETPGALFRQYLRYGRGRAQNLLKHRTWPRLRQLGPVLVAPAAVLALLTPWFAAAVLPLALWAALCAGCGIALGLKARQPLLLACGPVAMVMHSAWSIGFWDILLRRGLARLWRTGKA